MSNGTTSESAPEPLVIYSIGHSNQPSERFVQLLRRHDIQVLADVRSSPFSRYVPHFNRPDLEDTVERQGVQYLYLGELLGGRPEGDEFYDADGYVLYARVARAPFFLRGIERLTDEGALRRVAIMCSEEDPTDCHRRLLIGRVLARSGVMLLHIRGDGRVQREQEIAGDGREEQQLSLWSMPTTQDEPHDDRQDDLVEEDGEWKSIRPVSRRRAPPSSSERSAEPEYGDS